MNCELLTIYTMFILKLLVVHQTVKPAVPGSNPASLQLAGTCHSLLGSQQMAPLPAHRMGPTPPFWSTAVDLFGPLSIIGTVNKRTTRKVWGVIFVCTATSLTHVEIAESYSTEAFLLALRRFMALYGAPKRFQSDQGTQLVAASKQVKAWELLRRKDCLLTFCFQNSSPGSWCSLPGQEIRLFVTIKKISDNIQNLI